MATDSDIESAHEEMDYLPADDGEHDYPASVPCQLRFETQPAQDTGRFHDALADRHWAKLTHEPDQYHEPGKPNWQGEITRTGRWKRLRLVVFRDDLVRLFPRDDEPTADELAEVIEALEVGFDATLTHDPIERENTA